MKQARTASEIGKLIKYYRQERGLSQTDLATKSQMTQVSVSNIENGKGGTMKAIEKILRALELEVNFQQIQKIDIFDDSYVAE